jgi:hypothetical protein
MASANLHSLSTELICLILQSIHPGRDLYAFLQASSLAYRAFTAQKDFLLWHLAQCSMVPEVLVLAVTAVKLRNAKCARPGLQRKFKQISALAVEKLLGGHGKPSLPRELMSSADLTRLCQLQSVVEYFIHDYCSQELPVFFSPSSTSASDLSPTELARLQRAFYTYDIYQTRCYSPRGFHPLWPGGTLIIPSAQVNRHKWWELDEVACIRQYIRKRLEDIIDKLAQKLSESVMAQSDTGQPRRLAELSISTSNERRALINHPPLH